MKSHFRRHTESQQSDLLPWEKVAPQYKIEADRSTLKAVNVLHQKAPHCSYTLRDLGDEWFLDRIKASDFDEILNKEKLRLSTLWYREALFEREATENLAQTVQELVVRAAPVKLIKDCARAMLDELEHSRLCFSLVKALVGTDVCFKDAADADPSFAESQPALPSSLPFSKEDYFQMAWRSLHQGVFVQELSARFSIHLSRDKTYSPLIAELLKKSVDERRHSDLHWDIFSWSLKKLGRDYVEKLWIIWTQMPKAKFADAFIGDGKCRDYYREVRSEISERLQGFFEQEWKIIVGDHNHSEKALPISRPAS